VLAGLALSGSLSLAFVEGVLAGLLFGAAIGVAMTRRRIGYDDELLLRQKGVELDRVTSVVVAAAQRDDRDSGVS
jgi:hypothetical protein